MNPYLGILIALLAGAAAASGYYAWTQRTRYDTLRAARDAELRQAEVTQTEAQRTQQLLARVTEGILVLDNELRPLVANPSARAMLGFGDGSLPRHMPSSDLSAAVRKETGRGAEGGRVVRVWYPVRRELHVRAVALGDKEIVVAMRDVTEELRAHRIRREFVAHASHELKSPVASLQTLAEAVHDAVGDDTEAASRFSERMITEAARLGKLVTDLLDLSRLEDATRAPADVVDLSAVARDELRAALPSAVDKYMGLYDEVEPGLWVRGDTQQIGLMLRNLLDNAIMYTGRGGAVRLSVAGRGEEIEVVVTDDGMGIPLEAQERVFERFYRVDGGRSRDRGGTGLGLAIVKHAVELHGGKVTVDSEPGRGSAFTVRLPNRLEQQAARESAAK